MFLCQYQGNIPHIEQRWGSCLFKTLDKTTHPNMSQPRAELAWQGNSLWDHLSSIACQSLAHSDALEFKSRNVESSRRLTNNFQKYIFRMIMVTARNIVVKKWWTCLQTPVAWIEIKGTLGSASLCQNNASLCQNSALLCQYNASLCQNNALLCQNNASMCITLTMHQNNASLCQNKKKQDDSSPYDELWNTVHACTHHPPSNNYKDK